MNLSFKKKNIFISKPFTIFEIKNFLNSQKYELLYNSFPNVKYFDKHEDGITKDTFDSSNEKFKKFLINNPDWREFFNTINSESFIRKAFKESLLPNLKSRGLSALKIWTLHEKKNLSRFFFRRVSVKFIFSRIYKSKKIMPHTDATGKLMSMIYYFADKNWAEEAGGNTIFWKTREKWNNWDNWENKHITEDNYDNFCRENEILHTAKFEPNKIICFFKSKHSWHSAEKINPQKDATRKTLNIFIRILN